jgi:hypothetical protein
MGEESKNKIGAGRREQCHNCPADQSGGKRRVLSDPVGYDEPRDKHQRMGQEDAQRAYPAQDKQIVDVSWS